VKAPVLLALLLGAAPVAACDAVWRDGPRGRDVPLRIDLPAGTGKVPAVIWSPGLGGTRANASLWVAAWTAAGIAVIRLEHPGSDAAVYRGAATPEARAARVRAGAAPVQLFARIADVGFVADTMARGVTDCGADRIDTDRLGLAGHSMGAWVVQAMAGQRPDGDSAPLIDRRFRALIAMSTTGPADPAAAQAQFGGIGRPLLVITGSRDGVTPVMPPAIAAQQQALRTSLYTGAPADGRKALLIVDGADHMVFAGDTRKLPAETAMQARVAAVTTLWWRRWLLGDERAEAALKRPALARADAWARK
jgi:predicted dienelactone hydrolase